MIAKEKTTLAPSDKFGRAGHEAELQMAFYLRRAFAESPDVFVFNDLRLERNGECAQIDHLVFHRYGFVIIESKSVIGTITVNPKGEFSRIFDGYPRGIPSPIHQARLQAELLMKLLNDHKERLRRKLLFGLKQGEFGDVRFRTLVAISDQGVINRQNCDPPQLCKAERITDEIREIIRRIVHSSSFVGLLQATVGDRAKVAELEKDQMPAYTDEEMSGIRAFLLERHVAREQRQTVEPPPQSLPQPPPPPPPIAMVTPSLAQMVVAITCRYCKSADVTAQHGRYGYYIKCNACQGNTPIDYTCGKCKKKARIQKSGNQFARVCEACGNSVVVHENR